MNKISILIERGDKYGDCDIEVDLKNKYIVDKVLYSILTKESKQFISVYVYKIEK